MPTTPNSAFEELLRDVEPSATTKSDASKAHTDLRDHLARNETLKDRHVRTFLSGSYKRDTAIRPRLKDGKLERPDVDIIVIVDYDLSESPKAVLDDLHKALTDDDGGYENTRRQPRSVRVETSKAVMDVVALIEPDGHGGALYIPDRKASEWLLTNPPGHTQWTTDVNKSADGRFKPLVKLLKWWRRENPTISKDPKGFVLECLAADGMSTTEKHYGELFVGTLETVAEKYRSQAALELVPSVPDPSVAGQSVMSGVSGPAFKAFINKMADHAEKGRSALAETDGATATSAWRDIFGPRFPDLAGGQKSSLGPTPVPPVTFPDRPVKPNRPGGFASALVL